MTATRSAHVALDGTAGSPSRRARYRRRWFSLSIPGGRDFPKLWGAASVSYLGDGIYLAAMPLLAADLSSSPAAVAGVAFASRLPWLLLTLPAGALADTWDRKRAMWITDTVRASLMLLLALTAFGGLASIPLLMLIGFALGCADTVFDSNNVAIVPKMVNRDQDRIRAANTRLSTAQMLALNFVGPPLGGLLFTVGRFLPFLGNALSFVMSAILIRLMRGDYHVRGTAGDSRSSIRHSIREGVAWMWRNSLLRAITGIAGVYNVMFQAQVAVLVLFANEKLGLDATGYGLLLSLGATGSLIGTVLAARIGHRVGSSAALGTALAGIGVGCLVQGFATSLTVAGLGMALGGFFSMIWNVIQVSLRQSCTPDRLIGRVNGVHKLVTFGALPFGALLGGLVASTLGLRAPFWIAAGGFLLLSLAACSSITPARVAAAQRAAAHEAAQNPDDCSQTEMQRHRDIEEG